MGLIAAKPAKAGALQFYDGVGTLGDFPAPCAPFAPLRFPYHSEVHAGLNQRQGFR
jgi:hypothetical protein